MRFNGFWVSLVAFQVVFNAFLFVSVIFRFGLFGMLHLSLILYNFAKRFFRLFCACY